MIIYKALLAHGFDNFKLEILEHCKPSELIKREQYYIDLLKPEYNILKVAGSSLGVKRSIETIAKIRAGALSRSEEALSKNREHLKRLNASQKHKDHLAKLNASLEHISKTAKPVCVINTDNGESIEYRSITQAANFYNVHPEIVRRCIKGNKLLLNKYQITYKKFFFS
jgi:group I intron endonuclease